MQDTKLAAIATHVIKTPVLRNILIGCVAILIVLPTYSTFFVMPLFTTQLTVNTEDDARRTAAHLVSNLGLDSNRPEKGFFTPEVTATIRRAMKDFQLEKLKIFSRSGEIVYSSEARDIGHMNSKPYFREIVSKGKIYSMIVRKNGETAENRIVHRDVAEVYIPIAHDGLFAGAFEIYYDVTERRQTLGRLLWRSSVVLWVMAAVLLVTVMGMLFKISESMIRRRKAEEELQASYSGLESLVAEQVHEITVTQKTSVEALAVLAEYFDSDTGEHLVRIQKYVVLLTSWLRKHSPYCTYLDGKADYVNEVGFASLLHDIGKVAIPRQILTKPGKLTEEEFVLVKGHTLVAGEVLDRANESFKRSFGKDSYLALARDIALFHHEKWNGTGYPYGLKGETIPLSARITALADVYDALRSERPYKEAFSHADSVTIIVSGKGEHFDPAVVDAFIAQSDEFREISSCAGDPGRVQSPSGSAEAMGNPSGHPAATLDRKHPKGPAREHKGRSL